MISMYSINAVKRGWWSRVNVIIWGASAKLAGEDTQVQTEIVEMIHQGVTVEACKACCDHFDVSEKLIKLGINVRYMGEPLTNYIKNGEQILSM